MDKIILSHFSAGVSSAVATKLYIERVDKILYIHIDDQHSDTMRFVKECEEWFGKEITILQSPYKNVETVCRSQCFIVGVYGAPCTKLLKRRVGKEFELTLCDKFEISHLWGFDLSEKHRAERVINFMPEFEHVFPLIEQNIDKRNAHRILKASGIKRPAFYDLGYSNNNCIGCVKGGMGYWNKIRVDFPAVFASRAKMERDIGFSILKKTYLDELNPNSGRMRDEIMEDCGLFCEEMKI